MKGLLTLALLCCVFMTGSLSYGSRIVKRWVFLVDQDEKLKDPVPKNCNDIVRQYTDGKLIMYEFKIMMKRCLNGQKEERKNSIPATDAALMNTPITADADKANFYATQGQAPFQQPQNMDQTQAAFNQDTMANQAAPVQQNYNYYARSNIPAGLQALPSQDMPRQWNIPNVDAATKKDTLPAAPADDPFANFMNMQSLQNTAPQAPQQRNDILAPVAAPQGIQQRNDIPMQVPAPQEIQQRNDIPMPVPAPQEIQQRNDIPMPFPAPQEIQQRNDIPMPVPAPQETQQRNNIPMPVPVSQETQQRNNIPIPVPAPQNTQQRNNIPMPVPALQETQQRNNIPIPVPAPQNTQQRSEIPIDASYQAPDAQAYPSIQQAYFRNHLRAWSPEDHGMFPENP